MAEGAIVMLDPEIVPEAVRLMADHGLEIVCSLDGADRGLGGKVALYIAGEQLPPECAGPEPAKIVRLACTTEAYGSQRLTRISAIEVVGPAPIFGFPGRSAA